MLLTVYSLFYVLLLEDKGSHNILTFTSAVAKQPKTFIWTLTEITSGFKILLFYFLKFCVELPHERS